MDWILNSESRMLLQERSWQQVDFERINVIEIGQMTESTWSLLAKLRGLDIVRKINWNVKMLE